MSKRFLASLLTLSTVFALVIGLAKVAQAHNGVDDGDEGSTVAANTSTSTRKDLKDDRQELKGEIKDERKDLKGDRQALVRSHLDLLKNHLAAAVNRIEQLANRVAEAITRFKARGVDTTKAEADLAIAKTKITDAKNALANFETLVIPVTNASSTPTGLGQFRTAIQDIITKTKDAQKAVVQAVKDLRAKGAKDDDNKTATSTATTTTQ